MTGLIVAIDTDDLVKAQKLVVLLDDHVKMFKIGLEFFAAHGQQGVRLLGLSGNRLMLDLKLHDIPNTVAGACRALLPLRPRFLTVHASGGPKMIEAARDMAGKFEDRPLILAVTVLTSLDAKQDEVMSLAGASIEAGADGVVCSPWEAAALRKRHRAAILVCPGIRPQSTELNDQRRVATPSDAARYGADWIVVGRPITQANDPVAAAIDITKDMT